MPKGIDTEVKKAWRRIRQAWFADRPHGRLLHSNPPVWTIFHIGKRSYECRQIEFDSIIIRPACPKSPDGHYLKTTRLSQRCKGHLPDTVDLNELQTAIRLLEVEKVMDA